LYAGSGTGVDGTQRFKSPFWVHQVRFRCGAPLTRDGAWVLRVAFDITPECLGEQRGEGGR
jgi:hypothetical protein